MSTERNGFRSTVEGRQDDSERLGFFVWDMRKDLIFGDGRVADAFGLDPQGVRRGMPLQPFLDRIHPDDHAEAVDEIQQVEREGLYHLVYRVRRDDGTEALIRCAGFCFFDADGPVKKAGALRIVPTDRPSKLDDVVDHCIAAYHVSGEIKNPMAQYFLGLALTELGFDIARS